MLLAEALDGLGQDLDDLPGTPGGQPELACLHGVLVKLVLQASVGLENVLFEMGVDVGIGDLEKTGRPGCNGHLELLVCPNVAQNVWGPLGAHAVHDLQDVGVQ
jgi:hypothetical protein